MIRINNMLNEAQKKWKNKNFIYEKYGQEFVPITYGEFIEKAKYLAQKLLDYGLKDNKILIYGKDSIDYMITDLAVLAYVGISVNINKQTKEEELSEIIKKINIDAIIFDKDKEKIINNLKPKFTRVKFLCMQNEIDNLKFPDKLFEFEEKNVDGCSKIIFSSGTTSNPKGVMLSLRNMFHGWEPLQKRIPLCENDIDYLFIPMHHTYGNVYNFLYSFLSGLSIYLCSGIDKIQQELKEVNPTVFCGVPWIFEKIYNEDKENFKYAFGNKIKYLVCGGAKFNPKIRKAYKDNNLPMYETYALTEVASSFAIEYKNNDDFESGGTIFENIDVKIINKDDNGVGEIIVKGDNIFLGYANNEELTKSVFTKDRYFITGDYGYIKDNKIYIKGRKNDIIAGANGENVYPKEIEKKLKEYSSDILKVQAFLKDNKVNYKIFIKDGTKINIEEIIKSYNDKVTNKDCIKYFEIIYSSNEDVEKIKFLSSLYTV